MFRFTTKEKETERRRKISVSLKGRKAPPLSEEHKRKIGLASKGNKSHLGFKHTEEARSKIREARKRQGSNVWNKGKSHLGIIGDKHWNWQGGITAENDKERNSIELKLWKKACLIRDNFTCQKTGVRGGRLVVHHINNFADFIEVRTSLDNGITLSVESHIEFHKIYGKKNNTREQLNEFLYGNNL